MSEKHHLVIGIDLGTTYSAVAVYNRFEEETEIIPNPESVDAQGRAKPETTPSVVSVDPQSRRVIVGWPGKRNVADTRNTVIEIKREMGEVFREETLDKFHAREKYQAKSDAPGGYEGDPVRVMFSDDWYLPQEISAFTLMKMKELAEAYIGEPIRDAVITVPAYFVEKQKKATEEAALLAGLYPRQIIGEPTAAAICYGVDRLEADRKVYLVYDLGGGTFDVSIISVEEQQISVLATSGDPRLGGGDFDDAITDWAVAQLRDTFQLDATGDHEKIARIKAHAEQAKKDLASLNSVTMNFIDVWPHQPPALELTRQKFEELIEPLLSKSITYVDAALNQAQAQKGTRREDLDAILLVGGSTKIPRIKTLLLEHFEQDESFVSSGLNPDEVVARGAATVALKFAPSQGEFSIANRPDSSLINPDMEDEIGVELITEHSLGIGIQNNLISRIIDQGTGIPVSKRQSGFINGGPTDYLDVTVYQGEGDYTYQNTPIGTLKIGPMEPKPEGAHQFDVTFSLDDNGLLSMTVHHLNEGKNYQAQFEQKTGVGGDDALTARRNKLLAMKVGGSGPVKSGTVQPVQPGSSTAATSPMPVPTGTAAQSAGGVGPDVMPVAPVAPSEDAFASPPDGMQAPVAPGQTSPAPPPSPVGSAQTAGALDTDLGTPSDPSNPSGQASPTSDNNPREASGTEQATVTSAQATVDSQASSPQAAVEETRQILEPATTVPAEFKSVVRRSLKRLMNDRPEQLRLAFNQFVTLLNNGAPEDEIEEAGDHLENVYHDCR